MNPLAALLLTDPVCGREVEATSSHLAIYGGALFAFCGPGCKTQFLDLPSRYAVIASELHAPRPARPVEPPPRQHAATGAPAPAAPAHDHDHAKSATATALLDADALAALGDAHGPFTWLFAWRERRFAAACARQMLELHRDVAMRYPLLRGPALYRRIVTQRVGDEAAAQAVLHHAEQSFATWPAERALNYRDVVHYLAVSEYVATHPDAHWVVADMKRIVEAVIPQGM